MLRIFSRRGAKAQRFLGWLCRIDFFNSILCASASLREKNALSLLALAVLLLFAGCKKKENASSAESGKSGEPTVAELQKQLEEALNRQ